MTGALNERSLHDALANRADIVARTVGPAVLPEVLLQQVQPALIAKHVICNLFHKTDQSAVKYTSVASR